MAISAGAIAIAADLTYPSTVSADDVATTDGTTTSTTFTNTLTTTGIRGVSFTAGTSGQVLILYGCGQGRTNSAAQSVVIDCEVRTGTTVGSGTVTRSSNENTAVTGESHSASNNHGLTGFALVTGLTAGSSYNACITYRATGGTATFNRRHIVVLYVP